MYKRTTIINFFGCPASGKTTAAFEKCAELKKALLNQRYLFVNQAKRLLRAYQKVDYIVTDSPILLNIVYARFNRRSNPEFEEEVIRMHKNFNNENHFLPFNPARYRTDNRVHTVEQAQSIDGMVRQVFKECGMVYCEQCHKVSDKPIQYGRLILDYCQNCRG